MFKYLFLFFVFFLLGCHPVGVSKPLYASSVSSPYVTQNTQHYTSYNNRYDEEFMKTRLLDTLFQEMNCGQFKQELFDYFSFILFHINTPLPDFFNEQMQKYVAHHFSNKIAPHKIKLVSTMLSKMYRATFDFIAHKESDVALEDWSLVVRMNSGYGSSVSGSAFQKEYEYLDRINTTYDKLSRLIKAEHLCDEEKVLDRTRSFIVRDGMNIFEIANVLHVKNIVSKKEFLTICQDTELIKTLLGDEDIASLEGYLYPGKYTLNTGETAVTLVKRMVYRFLNNYNHLRSQYQYTLLPFSRHDVVTLASIIDEEAVLKHEKPVIASVFFNRLVEGMRLQSDPTVRYGVWWLTGQRPSKLFSEHFKTYNPYNTYRVEGLPRGPISNPGYSALHAVFNSDTTPYYFFVSRGDGRTHTFSETYEDHLVAVEDYRRVKRQQAGSIN